MAFKNSTKAWLNGVTVGVEDIDAGVLSAATIATNAITAVKISAGTIAGSKISANAVTGAKLSAGAVVAVGIASNAVIAAKISDGTVTNAKLANPAVVTLGPIYVALPNAASASHLLCVASPVAGTITKYGAIAAVKPTSGNLGILGYAGVNASNLWTSGPLNTAGITIASTGSSLRAYTSAPTAYSTVAVGDLISIGVTDAGSGASGLNVWVELTPS